MTRDDVLERITREEVLQRIRALLREQLGCGGALEPECELAGDLGLDSVKLLTPVVELENAFRVVLEPEEGEEAPTTLGGIAALGLRGIAQGEAPA